MRALARWLGGILLALTSWAAVPASVFASEPLTIEVTVISAGPRGVSTMVLANTLRGPDELDRVILTYTGVDVEYGPTTEAPTQPGTYRVTPSDASLSRGTVDSYEITYVGATFTIGTKQGAPSPSDSSQPSDASVPSRSDSDQQPMSGSTNQLETNPTTATNDAEVGKDIDTTVADIESDTVVIDLSRVDPSDTDELVVTEQSEMKQRYDIAKNADTVVSTQVAVYALLATAGTAAATRSTRKSDDTSEDSEERGELAGVKAGNLSTAEHDLGRGDASVTWRLPLTAATDGAMLFLAQRLAGSSPLLGRTMIDGAYLRAMLGALAVLLYPIAVILSSIAYFNAEVIVPASWVLVAAVSAVAVFDAAAGALAALSYILLSVATGRVSSEFDVLALLGISILWFAPPLIASAFRPFRRRVNSATTAWERLTDYALTLLLSHWAVNSMVTALPALSRLELPIAERAHDLAMVVTVAVCIRMLLEDLVFYHYPKRLRQQHVELPSPTPRVRLIANGLRIGLFAAVAYAFVGFTRQLFIVTILFAIPILIEPLGRYLPKSHVLSHALPRGTVKTIVMVMIGGLFATWTQQRFTDPELWVKWSMVILAIPGLTSTVLEICSDGTRERPWHRIPGGMWLYRIGGVFVFVLLWQAQRGVNPLEWLQSSFG